MKRIRILAAFAAASLAVLATAVPATAAPQNASAATACVASAIDLDGTDASVAPFTGTGTLTCTEPTTFTLRFLVNGQQVKQTSTSTDAGTVTVNGILTAAEAPGLDGGEKICFEVSSSGAREASGCLITPSPPAGSGDCVGLRADVERFDVSQPFETRYWVEAWIRCYYTSDLWGVVTVDGATRFVTSYPDAAPGDIPVFEGLTSEMITVNPGQELCMFGRPYGESGYNAIGACDTYHD